MAILRYKEILKMPKGEVLKKMRELELELAKERSNVSIGGTVKNPSRLREIRRTLARIKSTIK
ncbi:MAG: 50S ribosomal protein L29 [Candidatus Aenigmatarchaeota archaeon]|nr:MAG: 50S ribosomal protein L29 [Candidatus Aenigmarchaeota archaeon]